MRAPLTSRAKADSRIPATPGSAVGRTNVQGVRSRILRGCCLLLCLLQCLGLAACAYADESPKDDFSADASARTTLSLGMELRLDSDFGKLIKTASLANRENGASKTAIAIYDSGTLGTNEDMLIGASLGTISMALLPSTGFVEEHPEWHILGLHGLFSTIDSFNGWASYSAADLLNIATPGAPYRVLGVFATEKLLLCAREPVERVEDLSKLTIAIPDNAYEVAYWSAFGAKRVPFCGQSRTQLQQDEVDAIVCNMETVRQQQLNTIYRYILPDCMGVESYVLLINNATWNALQPEQQTELKQFVQHIYTLLASTEYRSAVNNYYDGNAYTVLAPSYEFRQALRNTAATLALYRRSLSADYVNALLEGVSRYNQGYPANHGVDSPGN